MEGVKQFFDFTGFSNLTTGHVIMIMVGILFIYLAIKKEYEPLLLIPIGFGILIGNIPFLEDAGLKLGIYEDGSVMNYLYYGVVKGIYPPLIFLGIGAMTDFSALLSNPNYVTGCCRAGRNICNIRRCTGNWFHSAAGCINWYYWRC
jgi:oxaloacetate decarboxylase beta subunit